MRIPFVSFPEAIAADRDATAVAAVPAPRLDGRLAAGKPFRPASDADHSSPSQPHRPWRYQVDELSGSRLAIMMARSYTLDDSWLTLIPVRRTTQLQYHGNPVVIGVIQCLGAGKIKLFLHEPCPELPGFSTIPFATLIVSAPSRKQLPPRLAEAVHGKAAA